MFALALALSPSRAFATEPPFPRVVMPSLFLGGFVAYSDLRLLGDWNGSRDLHGVSLGARLGTFVGELQVGIRGAGTLYGGDRTLFAVGPEVIWVLMDDRCEEDFGPDGPERWSWDEGDRATRFLPQLRFGAGAAQLAMGGDANAGAYGQVGLGATYGVRSFEVGASIDGTVLVSGPGAAFILEPQVSMLGRF
jgi:hypothetical protein